MSKTELLNKTLEELWAEKYVVPLYQRNFAWTEDQIGQLLQDIYDHSPLGGYKTKESVNYYLGSLVLLQRRDGLWEVIDGQQRLTALHIICRFLDILSSSRLTYDSRPSVERFFEELFNSSSWENYKLECRKRNDLKISRLVESLEIVEEYQIRTEEGERFTSLKNLSEKERSILADYMRKKVVVVCTPLPEDTDVAAYFEIMNNRGEQLQSHEIIKALLMRDLDMNQRGSFSAIWDACSQMDIPIQKSLTKFRSTGLFGESFDSLYLDVIDITDNKRNGVRTEYSIDQILRGEAEFTDDNYADDIEETDFKIKSIIDFPNFLMHAIRIYAVTNGIDENAVPLNADYMPVEKPDYISDSMDFIKTLLKLRVLFDRYVIKIQGDGEEEDTELKWRLQRPQKYEYVKNGNKYARLGMVNTFSNATTDDDEREDINNRIVKLESMLQVTFKSSKYKEWLYESLLWLYTSTNETLSVDFSSLLNVLEQWTVDYYGNLLEKWPEEKKPLLAAGTDTPRFLLNFIDYLYWLASKQDNTTIRWAKSIGDFQFRYYNSVEHHLPRSYENAGVNLDSIGNLCLISRRKNSSLNDKGPEEKAKNREGLQPKRQIMYKITRNNQHWGKMEIEEHQKDIEELLGQMYNLISV